MAPSPDSVAEVAQVRRELVFQDGSSNKFWNIELSGSSYTVTFGRIGTAGQVQTKEFDGEDAARKACDKLIAEKLKKGYADAAGSGAVSSQAVAVKAPAKPKAKAATTAEMPNERDSKSAPSAPSAKATPDSSTERHIDLEPADWFRATFGRRQPLDRGQAAPFDLGSCVSRLSKLRTETYGWAIRWRDLHLPARLAPEEAHFWLTAMTIPRNRLQSPKDLADDLATKSSSFTGKLSTDDVRQMLTSGIRHTVGCEAALAVANLLTTDEYLDLLLDGWPQKGRDYEFSAFLGAIMDGFYVYVLPYLTESEIASARARLRKDWDPSKTPSDLYEALPVAYYLAAALGMHNEVYEVISNWADDRYGKQDWDDHYHRPQDMVFGLGSSDLVEAEWRRLRLRMRSPQHVRAFLACTEYAALDCVRESVLAETNKEKCLELIEAFALVHAPEAAAPMLECKLAAKSPAPARLWLETHVGHAVRGLVEAAGSRGKLADAAIEFLRGVKRHGHAALIAEAVEQLKDAEAASKTRREVLDHEEKTYEPFSDATTPDWLKEGLAAASAVKARKLPTWAAPTNLPPLSVGERRLNDDQVHTVLNVLAATAVQERNALLGLLREHIDRHARDEFAWKLFQSWGEDGAPSKEKWAMGAIGHLGGDGCALKLTPLVRAWPGESQHQRAVFGLECLRAMGSDVALMQLAGCAQKLKFKGLKAKAEQFVNEIAAERGMTRAELEDRVVPDCGLDEQGRREFSFGSRSFSFVLGSDLKAMVKEENGKARGDLPKPGAKDDAAKAEQALADWKLLKKQIKEVATIQAGRLEQSMVVGRRWKVDDFVTLLVQHPLLTHLVRSLIWSAFDAKGQRLGTFRVTEERDFADVKDNAVSLDKAAAVGVVHPLEIAESERSLWGEVLSDYEIVSPFPQFGRAIYTLEPGEETTDHLKRFHGLKLSAPTLVFTLEKLGWIRGLAMDGGCFDEHSKQFPAADVTAVVGYEGNVGMGYIDPDEMLSITNVQFVAGMRKPSGYGWEKDTKIKLGNVPPVVVSEVMADLQVLKSKAK